MQTIVAVALIASLGLTLLLAQPSSVAEPVQLPPATKLHLYLLLGQSNMAGHGEIGEEDRTAHPRVVMFNLQGSWELATEPVTRAALEGCLDSMRMSPL